MFDNLAYKVDPDGSVTLIGQVARPTLKSDAENVVKRIEGVEKVVNDIEVLPTSGNDDRIRRATYRAIYGNSVLSQYQLRAVPPIHIIVKNGHVTLEGAVARQMDKQIAGMQANGVHGTFSVTNNLTVDEPEKKDDKREVEALGGAPGVPPGIPSPISAKSPVVHGLDHAHAVLLGRFFGSDFGHLGSPGEQVVIPTASS